MSLFRAILLSFPACAGLSPSAASVECLCDPCTIPVVSIPGCDAVADILAMDTLCTWDFTDFLPEWSAGSDWTWSAAGVELYLDAYLDPLSWLVQARDTLLSPPIPIPPGWSGLSLAVEHVRHRYGYGSSPCYSQTTTTIDATTPDWEDELWSQMIDQPYYDDFDTAPIIVSIPLAEAGDTMRLHVWGWVYCTRLSGSGTARAELEWCISRVSILGESTPVEPRTWASIKTAF